MEPGTQTKAPAPAPPSSKDPRKSPAGYLLAGLLVIGVGIYAYYRFANWEEQGGTIRENRILLFLYETTGKTGTLLIMCAAGGIFIAAAIRGWMQKRQP
jgi:hypothetical protein